MFSRRNRTVPIAFIVFPGGVTSIGPTSEFWSGDLHGIRMATVVVAAAFGLVAWRAFRLAIKVKPGRVIVRNMWATRWIDAQDVSRFERPQGVLRGGIRVVKANGRLISASAFGTMNNFESRDRGLAEVAELNAWLKDRNSPVTKETKLRPARPVRPAIAGLWRAWLGTLWLLTALATSFAVANIINPGK